jgi:hypothetical protein
MRVYTYSEARQQLAELLNRATREGQVQIRRRDGQAFLVQPTASPGSPLDVPGVAVGLSRREIVALVRESRRSTRRFLPKETARRRKTHPRMAGSTRRGPAEAAQGPRPRRS